MIPKRKSISASKKKMLVILKHILNGFFKKEQKTKILNKCVHPAMVYGAQIWTLLEK